MNNLQTKNQLNSNVSTQSAGPRGSVADRLPEKRTEDAVSRFGASTKLRGGGGVEPSDPPGRTFRRLSGSFAAFLFIALGTILMPQSAQAQITCPSLKSATNVVITPGANSLAVSWTAPTDSDRGGWELSYRKPGGAWTEFSSAISNSATSLTKTLTGLEAATEYEVRLGAIYSGAGTCPPGKPVKATVTTGVLVLTATAGDGEVALSWTYGGSGHTDWGYQVNAGSGWPTAVQVPSSDADTRSYTVPGLTNDLLHQFKVFPRLTGGTLITRTGGNVARATPVAPGVTVSKSKLTVPEGGSGTYTMKLKTKPSGNVTVTVGGMSGDVTVSGSPLTFTTANYGTLQTVTVNAGEDMDAATDPDVTLTHSVGGYGAVTTAASVVVSVTESSTSPGAPTSVAATGGNRHVVLSWTKPAGTVTGWKYQQKKGAGSYGSWVTMTGAGASATSYKIKPLDNGTAYHFKVRAVNAAGDGTASAEVSATPAAVAPVLTKAQSSGTEIRLEWTHAGGSNLDNYAYIPPGTGAVSSFSFFWRIFYRLKGATAWAERLNTSQQSGTNRRDMVFAPSGVSYIDGAVVEVQIRAEAISSRGGNTGPYSNTLEVTYRNPERLLLDRSRDSMVVAPGGSRTYAVALNFARAGRVMLTSSDTAKATVTPSHLDFTAQNYSTAQTVTVSGVAAASEDVTINHAFQLQGHLNTDAFPDVGTVSVKVSGTATPPPAKPAGFTATPGNRQVTLSWTDPGDSTITKWQYQWYTTPPFRGWTDIPSSGASTTTWTHTGRTNGILFGYRIRAVSPAGNGEVSEIRTVTPNPPGLTLSVSALTVAEEGSGVPYTVKLKTRPAGSVTVAVSGATGEVSVSPAALTFTTGNWNAAQTVTVSAGNDVDTVNDSATLSNSAGAEYGSLSADVAVTVEDNDGPELTLSRSELTVAEEGSGTYTVQLGTLPSGSVTVTVSGASGEVSASPTKLTFTTVNWNAAQTVTVSAGDDVDTANDSATLVNSAGAEYGSASKNVAVTVTDNDTEGLTLSVSELTVDEDSSGTYTVRLNTLPAVGVTVAVSGASGEVSASPTSLTFTTDNWNAAQTVTVSAGNDDDANNDAVTLVNSAGSEYGSVTEDLAVTVDDDDEEGLTLSVSELTVAEEGSGTYTVQLATLPSGSVTVAVSGASGEVSASPASLTFTTVNWNAAQTVTVSAGGDDDTVNDTATLVNRAGSEYGSVSGNVAVSVTDDDTEGVTLSVSELTVNEGSARTYTVQLATLPSGSVTVLVSGASGEVSASPTKLTFSTVNWNAAQTVTVTAGGDVDANDDSATLVNSAGGEYGSVSESLAVTVDDNDDDGLTLSASELTVAEGVSGTYTVKLDTLPSGSVTVTVSGASGEVSASPTKLTFSTVNWNAAQTVTVSAGGDDDTIDDTATLVNSAGSEYGSVSEELSVTVDDDDTEGVTLSVSGLTIAEGGTGTYTVKLDTLPAGSVTVTPSSDATAVATVSGPLTFSTGNWNGEQTVTVTAEEDDDSADGTAKVSHAVAGYGSATGGAVSVKVTDDDQLSTRLRQEHEGGIHELHVQFGQSMVGVANDIIVSRTSGAVSGRQNSMLIAGRQILFGPTPSSAVPLPPAYTDKPLRLDGDAELTRQRVDSVLDLLSDSSFNVSSATGQSAVEGGMTLWGRGGKTSFKRNGAGRSIDGSVTVGGIGFEFSQADWMGGLAYFRTRGKGNVTTTKDGDSAKSEEKVTMNSVHPYVHWQASEEVELWGTLGYGTGRADSRLLLAADSEEHRKGRMELLSALLGTRVSWDFDLAFKGEVSASRTTSKGLSATPMKSNQRQYKAVVEWSRLQALSDGGQLLPKVEAGVRYDDDSYSTGLSMVLAGSVRYTDADGRWSVEAGGSVLRSRASKRYRENGVYVGVELRSGADGFGPSMSIKATQGELVEALQSAWAESAIDGSESEREESDGVGTQFEFGYGMAMGAGYMKPKVSVLLPAGSGSQVYETGFEYRRGDRLSLELTHTHKPAADRGDGIRLGGSLRW